MDFLLSAIVALSAVAGNQPRPDLPFSVLNSGWLAGSSPEHTLPGHVLVDVHIRVAGQNRAPTLKEGAYHWVAHQPVPVQLERGISLVFDLDNQLRRIVNILTHAEADATDSPVKRRRAADEGEDLGRLAQCPHLDLQHPLQVVF